jgi:hypothetical protein
MIGAYDLTFGLTARASLRLLTAATVTCLLTLASAASAASLKLSLTAGRLPAAPYGVHKVPSAQVGDHVKLHAKIAGRVPRGAKVRLAVRPLADSPFKLQKGTITVRHGSATVTTTGNAGTYAYRLVVVSKQGRTLAGSPLLNFVWVPRPTSLLVSDAAGSDFVADVKTGAVSDCLHPDGTATCQDQNGFQSGTPLQLSATTNTGQIAGARTTLSFAGHQICTTNAFSGSCLEVQATMPTVTAVTYEPEVATYTDPSGHTFTATFEIRDHP